MNATIRHLTMADSPTYTWGMRLGHIDTNIFTAFLAEFKDAIPHRDRKWSPAPREWFLRANVIAAVEALLIAHKIEIIIESEGEPAPTQGLDRARAAAEMYLLPTATADVVKIVYRHLAKRRHPDMGGSHEQMQRLNAAMEILTNDEHR